MIHFFSDLDNTLIYSHRHTIPEPKLCVEELHGRQQSFMSCAAFDYLKKQGWFNLVPVTTRTAAQYERLAETAEALGWHAALIFNGSVLLTEGKEDVSWREESIRLAAGDRKAYEEILRIARESYDSADIVSEEHLMFYIKEQETDRVYEFLNRAADGSHVSVLKDARKVYCMPKSLNKGSAVRRYIEKYNVPFCIAAGDSEFDISMLDMADICICPETIEGAVRKCEGKMAGSGFFAEEICKGLEAVRMNADIAAGGELSD